MMNSIKPLFGAKSIVQFRDEYDFLSNFYKCEIIFDNETYPSLEHAYVAAKTLDKQQRSDIKKLTPGQAKRYPSLIVRSNWNEIKLEIMETLVRQKFSSNPLKQMLIETKDALIYEGNWWGDKFWGVDINSGEGQNNLGKIIMKIRNEII